MTSRASKFSAAFKIAWDERVQLAEERIAILDEVEDEPSNEDLSWRPGALEGAGHRFVPDEAPSAPSDRWENAQVQLTRKG